MATMSYVSYPYVITVSGKPVTLFSPRDFEDVLRESIGEDAVQFFRQTTEGAADEIRELTEAVRDLEQAYRNLEQALETTEALL